MRAAAGAGLSLFLPSRSPSEDSGTPAFTARQERLLDEIAARGTRFFYEEADPVTGLVRDRARVNGGDSRRISSIAATGFGLSALCVGDQRGFLGAGLAKKRVQATLEFLAGPAIQKHGFFPHFLDMQTGERAWKSEYSSIDTAWLLCGALHAAAYFQDLQITSLATEIYARTDWRWMLNGGDTLSHGWTPERGFLPYRWDAYSELLAMYLLAIGSPSHAIPVSCWDAWKRPVRKVGDVSYIESSAALFAHQYSHAWFDFRGRRDRYTDYFENSRLATEVHRQSCMSMAKQFPWYGENMWGVTASDSRRGYISWHGRFDGTVVPCAAGGSIVFMPQECARVLETILEKHGSKIWGRYGFVDAFHPEAGWTDPDVVGIDVGIMILMAENARTRSVWDGMMSQPYIDRSLNLVGLNGI